ncbi:zf-HC2 domain-containing protein [Kocuria flava]|uniref:zf-HC2 domain-containing protein n=1 Tax=Kocuria flava TaxID=446860 RepID=UPI000C7C6B10
MTRPTDPSGTRTDAELAAAVRRAEPGAAARLRARHRATALAAADLRTDDPARLADRATGRVLDRLRCGDGPPVFPRARVVAAVGDLVGRDPRSAGDPERLAEHYLALPPGQQAVLWHREVEGLSVESTARLLGLGPAATTALHLEARARLRAAWRRAAAATPPAPACAPCAADLGALADGVLTGDRARAVREHLRSCPRCTADHLHLQDTDAGLRGWLLPVLAGLPPWGAEARGSPSGWPPRPGPARRRSRPPRGRPRHVLRVRTGRGCSRGPGCSRRRPCWPGSPARPVPAARAPRSRSGAWCARHRRRPFPATPPARARRRRAHPRPPGSGHRRVPPAATRTRPVRRSRRPAGRGESCRCRPSSPRPEPSPWRPPAGPRPVPRCSRPRRTTGLPGRPAPGGPVRGTRGTPAPQPVPGCTRAPARRGARWPGRGGGGTGVPRTGQPCGAGRRAAGSCPARGSASPRPSRRARDPEHSRAAGRGARTSRRGAAARCARSRDAGTPRSGDACAGIPGARARGGPRTPGGSRTGGSRAGAAGAARARTTGAGRTTGRTAGARSTAGPRGAAPEPPGPPPAPAPPAPVEPAPAGPAPAAPDPLQTASPQPSLPGVEVPGDGVPVDPPVAPSLPPGPGASPAAPPPGPSPAP